MLVRVTWLAFHVVAYFWSRTGEIESERDIALLAVLLLLSFPLGLALFVGWAYAVQATAGLPPEGGGLPTAPWLLVLLVVTAGYLQWFVLLPRLLAWARSRRSGESFQP